MKSFESGFWLSDDVGFAIRFNEEQQLPLKNDIDYIRMLACGSLLAYAVARRGVGSLEKMLFIIYLS